MLRRASARRSDAIAKRSPTPDNFAIVAVVAVQHHLDMWSVIALATLPWTATGVAAIGTMAVALISAKARFGIQRLLLGDDRTSDIPPAFVTADLAVSAPRDDPTPGEQIDQRPIDDDR